MKKILPVFLIILPLLLGATGYMLSGEMFTDALYAAFALYFTNPVSDAYNVYIEIARWAAPFSIILAAGEAIQYLAQNGWETIKNRIKLLGKKNSICVYSDTEDRIYFENDVSVIYPGDRYTKYAKEHIILFSSDEKNLQFYEKHKSELADKRVYIGIREIESCFLNPLENVTLFDINSSIARMLWKDISLWNKGKEEQNIVVWGNDFLSCEIITTGLQMNLFSKKQKIKYVFVTDNSDFKIRHGELKLMNNDDLSYLDHKAPEIWDAVSKADIIILSHILDASTMQTIVVKAGEADIYYYAPSKGEVFSHFSFGNLLPFGESEAVLTDKNIRREALIRRAKKLNEHYTKLYGTGKDWNALSGFLKGSNISSSDFGEVLSGLEERIDEEEQAELEHIRWCRYMFLNYYTQGTPADGKNRNDAKRIHKDLIDYSALTPMEKAKDIEAIRITKNL